MLLAVAVVLSPLVPSQQQALAKGVFFDPDSPAGKEYALPLDQAREEAVGGKSDGPAGKRAPLFGEGVSGRGSGPGAGGEGHRTDADAITGTPTRSAARGEDHGSQRSQITPAVAAVIPRPDDRYPLSSAILWVAAVVALGGIAGLVLKAAQRPRSSP